MWQVSSALMHYREVLEVMTKETHPLSFSWSTFNTTCLYRAILD